LVTSEIEQFLRDVRHPVDPRVSKATSFALEGLVKAAEFFETN